MEKALNGLENNIWLVGLDADSSQITDLGINFSGLEDNDWFNDQPVGRPNTAPVGAADIITINSSGDKPYQDELVYIIQSRTSIGMASDTHDILNASIDSFDGICLDCGASLSVVGNS